MPLNHGNPIAIATSDWHLDLHAWADRPEIAGDSLATFRQIVSYAIKHRLPILAAGDLLDRKPNFARLVGLARVELDRLQAAGIPLWFIQGQHELQPETPWLLAIHNWPKHLSSFAEGVEIAGHCVWGMDWQPRENVSEALSRVPSAVSIVLAHQVCHEFMGGITIAEMDFGQIPHAKLLIVGDYHEHRTYEARGSQGQLLKVLSPGSTNMRKIDEPPQKKFFVVNDDLSFKSVQLRTRPYLDWELLDEDSLEHFIENIVPELQRLAQESGLPADLAKPLLRVRYREELPNAYARIAAAVGTAGHLFTKVLVATRDDEEAVEGEETYAEVEELGLLGCLPLMVDETEEPEVFQLVHQLLATDDPQAALAAARGEYFTNAQANSSADA